VALELRKNGITRVRPLAGGFFAWRDLGYPLVPFYAEAETVAASKSARA
jgi:rhodanese-related sulfurtransferase